MKLQNIKKILISAALALHLWPLQRRRESVFAPLASKQREEAPQIFQNVPLENKFLYPWTHHVLFSLHHSTLTPTFSEWVQNPTFAAF